MSMEFSDRGFLHGDEIPSEYGGFIKTYESSSAAPTLWVRVVCPSDLNDQKSEQVEAVALLTRRSATLLRDQLTTLIERLDS